MDLSSRALCAPDVNPLWKIFEQRLDHIGRQAMKTIETMALFRQIHRNRVEDNPTVERIADTASPNSSGAWDDVDQHDYPERTRSNDQTTVVVLALDEYNARVYHDMLEMRGYCAVTALDVENWLSVLNECAPDLILVDLCSSDHPSVDITRAIMRDPRYKSVPIIAVTDAHKSGDLSDPATIIFDYDGRIEKPITVDGFFQPIEAILRHATVCRRPRR